ncbi:TIGR03619 family F420-dependent LLM class oxidoreductase [Nocardia brasiliensis]|uniref:TIGR03619 family F420-dependent LLM class oxidoreductase n=1 Tax=Nocardia brasiliensis TaxID=37326 RepID=UPI0024557F75|nr:TIGR03619 family F420-dependent LLM class oxidoreductase [Nocardia brasiliensis]
MRIGIASANIGHMTSPQATPELACAAEELGYSTWWTLDHLATPSPQPEHSPMDPALPVTDSFVYLAYVAACTSSIDLGTAVIVLPTHPPLLTAKQVASLDLLSNGRVRLGIGIGYLEPELAAAGVAMTERGTRTDEYLQAMHAIWTTDPVEYHGEFVTIDGIAARPHPPAIPYIAVGGDADRALRRAITYGNAWIGGEGHDGINRTAATITRLEKLLQQHPRPTELGRLEIINMVHHMTDDQYDEYQQLGVDETVLMLDHTYTPDQALAFLHRYAPYTHHTGHSRRDCPEFG